jgi:CO dehydrogenase nickel-insertion accessory protein CooC1
LLGELEGDSRWVIGDAEAGLGVLSRMQQGRLDRVLIVAQPSAKSIDVAARAVRIAAVREQSALVVANRVTGDADMEMIRAGVGIDVFVVPDDEAVLRADEDGRAPIDVAPEGPAVTAVGRLAERLLAEG